MKKTTSLPFFCPIAYILNNWYDFYFFVSCAFNDVLLFNLFEYLFTEFIEKNIDKGISLIELRYLEITGA